MSRPAQAADEPQTAFDAMVQDVTQGLTDAQRQQWQAHPGWSSEELQRLEVAATAAELAQMESSSHDIPESLREQLLSEATAFFAGQAKGQLTDDAPQAPRVGLPRREQKQKLNIGSAVSTNRINARERLAWCAAVAASLLAVGLGTSWWNAQAQPTQLTLVVPTISLPPASPAQQLERLLAEAPDDLVDLNWNPVHDADAGGRVVWSDERQEGYMVFENLDVNDPQVAQYQLWIFDTDKTQDTPVDGGVFDITRQATSDQPLVIPIRAHIPVERAVQFAVTVERPGGVTVSQREQIPVLAAL